MKSDNSSELTIVTKKFSFLKGESKENFSEHLKTLLTGNVLEAYIFGSFFSDDFNADSDIDLLIIVDTKLPFHERILYFKKKLNLDVPMDLIAYTSEEFQKIRDESPKVGFWKSVFESMTKIV